MRFSFDGQERGYSTRRLSPPQGPGLKHIPRFSLGCCEFLWDKTEVSAQTLLRRGLRAHIYSSRSEHVHVERVLSLRFSVGQ